MNKQERAVLRAAIDKYGNDSQLAVAQEECAELIQAIDQQAQSGWQLGSSRKKAEAAADDD